MPRGGARTGAGRPPDIHTKLSPEAVERARARIQTDSIIQRLTKCVTGEVDMKPAAVTAALGLLRKVLPDMTAVEHSGEVANYIARMPAKVRDMNEWRDRYGNQTPTHPTTQ